jgi:hypothetical protein
MSKKTSKAWALVRKDSGEVTYIAVSRSEARDIKESNEKIARCTVKLD